LLFGQLNPNQIGGTIPPAATAAAPNRRVVVIRPNAPDPSQVIVRAVRQEVEGSKRRLRGKAEVETFDALLTADEMDYDEESGIAEARGNVTYRNYQSGEELKCSRAEYDVNQERGRFYDLSGTFPVSVRATPGMLVSDNPFYIQGKWAERIDARYILHDGFVTSCKMPKPWWVLRGPVFDVAPGQRAIARSSVFRLRNVPILYFPYFYKSLEKSPRRSGFLVPNFGNNTRRGQIYGAGYYWAISRNMDLTYRAQYFTLRGFSHLVDFRSKPTQRSELDVVVYGVADRGRVLDDGRRFQEGGFTVNATGRVDLGRGWNALASINYLSSFLFRQAFTETFTEAVFSEVNSVAVVTKGWKGRRLNALFQRNELFQSALEGDKISVRKLPQVEFLSRERRFTRSLPVYWSLESSGALVQRNQLLYQTRQFVERADAQPRVTLPLSFKNIHLVPSLTAHGSFWGSRFDTSGFAADQLSERPLVTGQALFRTAVEAAIDIRFPALARTFQTKNWMGDKLKHVIEPRLSYRYVTGVNDFRQTIRFDELEMLNNTNEMEVAVANRFYSKKGTVTRELVSWEVWQRRYFDPTFGGALVDGRRNTLRSTLEVSGWSFIDGPRRSSPVVSNLRLQPAPALGIEWRTDYDPVRGNITNSAVTADGRLSKLFLSVGHNHVATSELFSPRTNQFRGLLGFGGDNRKGWSAGFFAIYDYTFGVMPYSSSQVTYNTDCCGFSVQYRRLNFGTRNENQFRIAFAIANIGSFGTLRRQERFF
jgi:LPS-assembly protein